MKMKGLFVESFLVVGVFTNNIFRLGWYSSATLFNFKIKLKMLLVGFAIPTMAAISLC
jgi:hypothetical protein